MAYLNGRILDAGEAAGRNTNAIMQNWIDRGPWFYYDTAVTASPGAQLAQNYNMFSVPIGSQDPLTNATKTKLATNMTRQNQFPPPRCLVLMQVGFYFSSTMIKSDIDLVLDGCYMEFRIDDKVFHEGQLFMYPSGAGLNGTSTQNGESAWTNGLPAPQYTRRFQDWSKYIAPLQQFSLNIIFPGTPPTLTGSLRLVAILDGLTDRSVQ